VRDGLREMAVCEGTRRATDIVRFGFAEHFDAGLNVIPRIDRMCIHADDDFTLGFTDRAIQSGRNNLCRIFNHAQRRTICLILPKNCSRSIVAHPVGDQDFHINPIQLLIQNGIQKCTDVANFVPARDHDGNSNVSISLHE
jgi:hypothetical protein